MELLGAVAESAAAGGATVTIDSSTTISAKAGS